jgi:DNA-binding IclR family transcriptional regulator
VDTYLEFSTDPHTAASGKILLPELSRDAIQEIYRHKIIAVISVTGSIFSVAMERINQELIGLVKETAERISSEMPR